MAPHVGRAAPYIDNFDNTSNLNPFGGLSVSTEDNVLTASRTVGNTDSGFDWRPGGTGNFSLLSGDEQFIFSLHAVRAVNDGYYAINALIFDSVGDFLAEISVQTDTNVTGSFDYNIASLASSVAGAEQWFARVRVLPFESNDAAFEFETFGAVPEPSTYALLALAAALGAAAWRRRRP